MGECLNEEDCMPDNGAETRLITSVKNYNLILITLKQAQVVKIEACVRGLLRLVKL